MDPADKQFNDFLERQWLIRGRFIGVVGLGFNTILFSYDYFIHPATLFQSSIVRTGMMAMIAAMLGLSYIPRFEKWSRLLTMSGIVMFGVGSDLVFHLQGAQAAPDRVFAYTATAFVAFYIVPMGKPEGLTYLAATYISYAVNGAIWGYPPATFAGPYLIQAGVMTAVGIIGNQVLRTAKREEMAASTALEQRSEQLAEAKIELEATLDELRLSQAALSRAEGLAAVSEFVNGIAHEINNPLASARSLLETVGDDVQFVYDKGPAAVPKGEIDKTLEGIRTEIDRARTLIREVRSLAEEVQNSPGTVDLATLLREVINEVRTGPAATLDLKLDVASMATPLVIKGHYARLRRVFLNLVDNAINAELKAGHPAVITIVTKPEPGDRSVRVLVEDHGIGIAPEIREKIFQPFFTTRRTEHRPGLGLYIAHEIVRSLGGQITVDSEPGIGSRFTVTLPVEQAAA